ncbi:50S ribosomal protein L10 [candidate division WWE3 bacterium RIFCSPHIGHO2_01_FULL_48_15]|uniref:Large ribosomal subunit protein uL10 n=1 Tax=candidate division WWE3 bacterium RIFCSPHIGHO2_01_FULL_48_15 TaxID=1802619 RepID=A0A1F4VFI4_UNCKA|nr:MAG: 50S ribosomal protein L10 [candidate division WWE3 bacterium RIFCSPHIGHO2_01_FULL_48_15]
MTTKEEKVQQVEELAKEAEESGAVVFADYRGLTVSEMAQLRKKLADLPAQAGMRADLKVVKNTLLRFSLEKAKLSLPEQLTGPTAVLFSRAADPIESIKTLVTFFKAKEKGEVKAGFWEKTAAGVAQILALAALPGRKVLEAQLVSQLSSPVYRLVYALSGQPQRLVSVLNQIKNLSEAKSPVAFSEGGTKGGVS